MKNLIAALVVVAFTAFSVSANTSVPVAKPGTTVCAKDSSNCTKKCDKSKKCDKADKKCCTKKK